MKSNYLIKSSQKKIATILSLTQVDQIFRIFYSGVGSILMFHRVIPQTNKIRIHNHQSLEVTPEHLEKIIIFFKKRGYKFISIDELPFYLKKERKQKFVIFTFDDGYYDNYEFALPIFQKYNIPFCIYVSTSFPDESIFLWWYFLEEILIKNNELIVYYNDKEIRYNCDSVLKKEETFNKIRRIIIDGNENSEFISQLFFKYKNDISEFSKRKYSLSWNDIKELSNNPLVTIGAHTINHKSLRKLTYNEAINEIILSQSIISGKIDKQVKHFAYPFGSKNEITFREIEIMNNLDFETAVTTNLGNIFHEHKEHIFALPRLNINASTNNALLKLMINGLIPAVINKFKKVIYI